MKQIAALAAMALLPLLGCNRNADVVGTWKANIVSQSDQKNALGDLFQRAFGGTIVFRSDGTCDMTMLIKIPCTYQVSGSQVTLSVDEKWKSEHSSAEVKMDKPMVLNLSADGQTLTPEHDNSNNKDDLVFQKQPS